MRRVQAQPYRALGRREPGQAFESMQRGRTLTGWNPADVKRQTQRPGGQALLAAYRRHRKPMAPRQPRQPRQPR